MHLSEVAYNKKALAPLYGKLTKDAIDQGKKIVVGDSYGLRTRYNILLRLFHENIAPSVGNLDALCGGLVNLLAYSHEVFCKGQEAQVEPIDVMDFIHREMYECILSKKAPVYALYVMRLIKRKMPNYTLCIDTSKLVEHKAVKPQKRPAPGVTNEPFAATSEDEGDEDMEGEEDDVDEGGEDGEEEIEENQAAPPSSPKRRSKNASNVPFPSRNKEEVNKQIKKLLWFKSTLLCMGVDIRKEQHNIYIQNKHITHNQGLIVDHLRELHNLPPPEYPSSDSEDTLSYGAWYKEMGSSLQWGDFDEVSKPNYSSSSGRGKGPLGDDEDPSYESNDKDGDE
jgi:hypothetical protein